MARCKRDQPLAMEIEERRGHCREAVSAVSHGTGECGLESVGVARRYNQRLDRKCARR
jgi:hypothetical protein